MLAKFGITNGREPCAALACYWLVGLMAWMVTHPAEFTHYLMRAIP